MGLRILICDDSPMINAMLSTTLNKLGYEVCGIAKNGHEAVAQYAALLPDVVFMDMTMPVMDGLEAASKIKGSYQDARIIMLSAMADEGLQAEAGKIGIDIFLKKPFEPQMIVDSLAAIMNEDQHLIQPFSDSLSQIFFKMTQLKLEPYGKVEISEHPISSLGISALISFTGKIYGRFMIDVEPTVAWEVARLFNGNEYQSVTEETVMFALSELANIVIGDALTNLNNKHNLLLRPSPPIVFAGDHIRIALPQISSAIFGFTSPVGNLQISVAFKGGIPR